MREAELRVSDHVQKSKKRAVAENLQVLKKTKTIWMVKMFFHVGTSATNLPEKLPSALLFGSVFVLGGNIGRHNYN